MSYLLTSRLAVAGFHPRRNSSRLLVALSARGAPRGSHHAGCPRTVAFTARAAAASPAQGCGGAINHRRRCRCCVWHLRGCTGSAVLRCRDGGAEQAADHPQPLLDPAGGTSLLRGVWRIPSLEHRPATECGRGGGPGQGCGGKRSCRCCCGSLPGGRSGGHWRTQDRVGPGLRGAYGWRGRGAHPRANGQSALRRCGVALAWLSAADARQQGL